MIIEATVERLLRSKAAVVGSVLMALGSLLAVNGPAFADTTFTVNSTLDPGTGSCDATECTLREAISAANNAAGADTINFDIGGDSGVKHILLASGLPFITEAVTIDGYTQPGASPNTLTHGTNAVLKIELRPARLNSAPSKMLGLFVNTSDSVIKGLVLNRFDGGGILLGGTGNRVPGNFIGTDPSGTQDLGNRSGGVGTLSSNASDNLIGGSSPAARNLISGNDESGINLNSPGNEVEGNLIGTQKNGKSALGNFEYGVFIAGGDGHNTIGGTTPETANTIAFNGFDGVKIIGGLGHRILGNSIFSNIGLDGFGGLGINLVSGSDSSTFGANANDPGDADTFGPNGLQNKPAITSAVTSSGATTIKGRLNSTPDTSFTIQYFSNPSGNEGKRFIGEQTVSTNQDGIARLTLTPAQAVDAGEKITATATGPEGTSEFSAPRAVVAQ